jgi:hypothetical protein
MVSNKYGRSGARKGSPHGSISGLRGCYAVSARPVASVWNIQPRFQAAERPFVESWARLGPGQRV